MRGTEFSEMSAFAAIAERRSFARAAVHLGVTTSTLSHNIRNLEERLGVRLLNRTTRSVAPTEIGERLLARLKPALADLEEAVEALNEYRDKPAGNLRVTVPPPAAGSILAPMLARFLAEHPAITLEVSVDGAMVDIVSNRFDAGIRIGEIIDRDMISVRIGDAVQPVAVASPGYLARKGSPRTVAELRDHDCIRIRLPGGGYLPWRFQISGKPVDVSTSGPLVVNDRELEHRAAIDGIGIAYLPRHRVADEIADGRLAALLEDCVPPPTNFHLYYPSRRQVPPALRALIECLRTPAPSDRPESGADGDGN